MRQFCDDPSDIVLIKNNGVAGKWNRVLTDVACVVVGAVGAGLAAVEVHPGLVGVTLSAPHPGVTVVHVVYAIYNKMLQK